MPPHRKPSTLARTPRCLHAASNVLELVRAMPPKLVVRNSPIHGKGLFAVSRIRRDTKLGTYVGTLTQQNGPHVLWLEDADGNPYGIDGTNDLRFVNHSNEPNAVFLDDELYALRNIQPGAEITFDYGEEWHELDLRHLETG